MGALHVARAIRPVRRAALAKRKWSSRESEKSAESLGNSACFSPGSISSAARNRRRAAEHDKIDERIWSPAGWAPCTETQGRLAQRHQARHDRIGIAADLGQRLATIIVGMPPIL